MEPNTIPVIRNDAQPIARFASMVVLKSVRTSKGRDGEAISASLWLHGKRVGDFRNEGRGGCNDYSFTTPAAETELNHLAREWAKLAKQDHEYTEIADIFLDALALYQLDVKTATKLLKKGDLVFSLDLHPMVQDGELLGYLKTITYTLVKEQASLMRTLAIEHRAGQVRVLAAPTGMVLPHSFEIDA